MAVESDVKNVSFLSKNIHMWPDYHGNRSPLSNPNLKGMLCGLQIKNDAEDMALLYLATIQALAVNFIFHNLFL